MPRTRFQKCAPKQRQGPSGRSPQVFSRFSSGLLGTIRDPTWAKGLCVRLSTYLSMPSCRECNDDVEATIIRTSYRERNTFYSPAIRSPRWLCALQINMQLCCYCTALQQEPEWRPSRQDGTVGMPTVPKLGARSCESSVDRRL